MSFVIFIFIMIPFSSLATENMYKIEAVVNTDVELPCNVTAGQKGDRLNILAWYGNGSSSSFYSSRDLRAGDDHIDHLRTDDRPDENDSIIRLSSSEEDIPERYHLISQEDEGIIKLLIRGVRPSDAGVYRCKADFVYSRELNTYVQLEVIEPPHRLWVIYDNGTHVATSTAGSNISENIGPYYIGEWVEIHCVAFNGKPLADVIWWAGQQKLKNTTTPLSEQRIGSHLKHGPLRREDHGLVLSCTANNNNITLPLAIDVIVNMYLPPELVSIRDLNASTDGSVSAGRVQAGQTLHLQCRVLGARPTPEIAWRLNDEELVLDQNLTKEPSQRLVISEVRLSITEAHDEGHVTCCAPSNQREGDAVLCAQAMHLTVTYQPVLQIIVDDVLDNNTLAAVKGSDVVLNCTYRANPPIYQIMWFHDDDVLPSDTEEELPMHPVLTLYNVSESDAGEYVCAASNDIGPTYTDPIVLDITYPASCVDPSVAEYGVGEGETVNITCKTKGNPEASMYRWIFLEQAIELKNYSPKLPQTTTDTLDATIEFQRPNGSTFNTIFCWGLNGVTEPHLPHTPCTILVTDETVPHPPADCKAEQIFHDITIECEKGHDGGLPQKFKFSVNAIDSDHEIMWIVLPEPKFKIQEPTEENYKFVIVASNDKGDSLPVEIDRDSIIQKTVVEKSAVRNLTTLALSLCGGVLLVVLAACGLVLCSYERAERQHVPRGTSDPPLCAYNTDESQCETYHGSEDGSDCNVRRTESFRRAMQRYPSSRNYDVRRTSSFQSARFGHEPDQHKPDSLHTASCRVHSMQNLSRKREMEAACDHLIMHLPPEPNYHVAKPMNTFYTMPRKTRNKSFSKQIRDDTSEITQNSDQFSLPPPPDEFGTYRAAARIRDIPVKTTPTYTTIKKSPKPPSKHNNDSIISPMNTVGLPTISGTQTVYSYPDDHVSTNPFDDSS